VSDQINFHRLPQVMQRTGLRRSAIYKLMLLDLFPRPIPILGRHVAWLESTIDTYNRMIAERASAETIRAFVKSLNVEEKPKAKRSPRRDHGGAVERVRARA
jgi:prophage regulatory protein